MHYFAVGSYRNNKGFQSPNFPTLLDLGAWIYKRKNFKGLRIVCQPEKEDREYHALTITWAPRKFRLIPEFKKPLALLNTKVRTMPVQWERN